MVQKFGVWFFGMFKIYSKNMRSCSKFCVSYWGTIGVGTSSSYQVTHSKVGTAKCCKFANIGNFKINK